MACFGGIFFANMGGGGGQNYFPQPGARGAPRITHTGLILVATICRKKLQGDGYVVLRTIGVAMPWRMLCRSDSKCGWGRVAMGGSS